MAPLAMVALIGVATVVGICVRACVDNHWSAVAAWMRRRWRPGGDVDRSPGPLDAR